MSNSLRELEQAALMLRRNIESIPWHTNIPATWTPEHNPYNIVPTLAKNGFDVGWWISYDEGTTIIDARRAHDFHTWKNGDRTQSQLHARGRAVRDNGSIGLQWAVHVEPSPITAPGIHYAGNNVMWGEGQKVWVKVSPDFGLTPSKKKKDWNPKPLVDE